MNRVFLCGHLTRDPELKYIPSGTAVCDIGLAVNEKVKQGDEWVEVALFTEVTLWARTAEVASEFLTKGSPVLIEGRLKLDQWEDQEGNKRSKLKVIGERMQMLSSKGEGQQRPPKDDAYSAPAEPSNPAHTPNPDIPF